MDRQQVVRKKKLEALMFDVREELRSQKEKELASSKKETVSCADIAEFLQLSALGHKKLFHYTKMENVRGILESKQLYLSRLSEMNDLNEYRGTRDADRTYLACFSFGEEENMAMWKMYGGSPDESVRIQFGGATVAKCIGKHDHQKVYPVRLSDDCQKGDEPQLEIEEWSFHDVAYTYGKALMWNRKVVGTGRCRGLSDPYAIPELKNRVKDFGWNSESEVRLVIRLTKSVPGLSRIAVDFDKPISSMSVLLGPSLSKQTKFKCMLERSGKKLDDARIKESSYEVKF